MVKLKVKGVWRVASQSRTERDEPTNMVSLQIQGFCHACVYHGVSKQGMCISYWYAIASSAASSFFLPKGCCWYKYLLSFIHEIRLLERSLEYLC